MSDAAPDYRAIRFGKTVPAVLQAVCYELCWENRRLYP
jgi:hypothetical protein